jgi:hypothetical protein
MNKLETTKNKVKPLLPNGWTVNNAMGLSLTGQHTPEYLSISPDIDYKNDFINSLPTDLKKGQKISAYLKKTREEAFAIGNILSANNIKHHVDGNGIVIVT